jgi:hypothetical protein
MNRLARNGDTDDLAAYLTGPVFERAWVVLTPQQRIHLCEAVTAARAQCEARTRRPIPKPQRRGGKFRWDAARIARLASAYAKAGPNAHEKVARIMGDLTPGAAKVAQKRFLVGATEPRRKAA